MAAPGEFELAARLESLSAARPDYAIQFVELLLEAARAAQASDIHLQPVRDQLEIRWRLDGVLQGVGAFPRGAGADVVARLKVLAELLTYRTDVPQEGRIRQTQGEAEIRVSTFPTLHGERAVVRLFAAPDRLLYLRDLGYQPPLTAQLETALGATSGAVLVCGPAGSGKTTTVYACLRELARREGGGRSLVSLEDPIEAEVPGVSQSQVHPAAGYSLATGVRSLMRQDPEVILVGEIRDRETAEAAMQAALTGHLLLTTFHAGSAAAALSRLSDMGIEPYLIRSSVVAVVAQRLVRALCNCKQPIDSDDRKLGLIVRQAWQPAGCDRCRSVGYRGRLPLAEFLSLELAGLAPAVLARHDAFRLEQIAADAGMVTLADAGRLLVERGVISPAEFRRVLGFAGPAQ